MDVSRRRFLGGRTPGPAPFRPPWSVSEALFLDRCTRCDDCLKVCPTGLLQRGPAGFPLADFSEAACTLCGDCARACATGAIGRDTTLRPWFSALPSAKAVWRPRTLNAACAASCAILRRSAFAPASAARPCPRWTTPCAPAAVPALPPVPSPRSSAWPSTQPRSSHEHRQSRSAHQAGDPCRGRGRPVRLSRRRVPRHVR
jgi:ferredoxin-type protein NapF